MIDSVVFDIESTDLAANIGATLVFSYMSSKDPGVVHTLRIDETDKKTWSRGIRGTDRELVKQANAVLRSHQIGAAHYGTRFDLPYLRTRALIQGLAPLHDMVIVDPWAVARRKFKFHNNRLDSIAKALGSEHRKTPLDLEVWRAAKMDGDRAAMDLIVEHCEADVRVLNDVLQAVKPFIRIFDAKGSDL